MHDNARKITKIIDELVYYLMRFDTQEILVSIAKEEPYYVVTITGLYNPTYYEKIHDIERMLMEGSRDKSIETEYWELMGLNSSSFDSELQLIGMMVDEAHMKIEKESLWMEIKKKVN